ncbi:HEPN domain-containing protein [Mucilaginibacter sp. PAMB04168]|uniref:HEPN domain-containing protein n=1 Tax=Mucilaginibacter sp. PAMB04168 TaxID=3138567 RepID=UPI0031F63476
METPAEHLHPIFLNYQELDKITAVLVKRYQPEKIICFGSLQQSASSAGCFMDSKSQHTNHYFLLMVTANPTRIEHEVQAMMTSCFKDIAITIVVHGREIVSDAITKGNRFFITVYRTGTLLHNAEGLLLSLAGLHLPQIDTMQTYIKAEHHYKHRYEMALGFMEGVNACMMKGYYNNAVFMMHQAIEQACIGLIRIFIGYRSDMHNLDRLFKLTLCFSPEPSAIFPRETEEDWRLFNLFHKCYSEARYKTELQVTKEDAELLHKRCIDIVLLVEALCLQRITLYKVKAEEAAPNIINYNPALPASLSA